MKPDGIHVVEGLTRSYLFLREPFLVGTAKLKLVPVVELVDRSEYRADFRQVNFPDTPQLVFHLLLLCFYLLRVGQMLPLTSAANAKMFTGWFTSHSTFLVETHDFGLHETVFFAFHLQVNDVAWCCPRHKYDHVVNASKGFPFCGNSCYLNILQ